MQVQHVCSKFIKLLLVFKTTDFFVLTNEYFFAASQNLRPKLPGYHNQISLAKLIIIISNHKSHLQHMQKPRVCCDFGDHETNLDKIPYVKSLF